MKYKLKIKTLDRGFVDGSRVLLHASFQILVDYMEKEDPAGVVDWSWCPEHVRAWEEIKSLYEWWKIKRPAREDPLDREDLVWPPDFLDYLNRRLEEKYPKCAAAMKEHSRLEEEWEKEDQKNLHRLIEIRGHLWT